MELSEFLLARVAEAEAAARVALAGPWVFGDDGHSLGQVTGGTFTIAVRDATAHTADLNHIARHDPARVLAECAAKRAVVERFERVQEQISTLRYDEGEDRFSLHNARLELEFVLRALAQPYADHPDFDEAWRL